MLRKKHVPRRQENAEKGFRGQVDLAQFVFVSRFLVAQTKAAKETVNAMVDEEREVTDHAFLVEPTPATFGQYRRPEKQGIVHVGCIRHF